MKTIGIWLAALSGFALVAGCGGGGGGGNANSGPDSLQSCTTTSAAGTINYSTTWGNAPANASEVILILDGDSNVVRSDSVNRGTSSTSTIAITGIPAGVYEFRVKLYDSPNGTGNFVGLTRDVVNLCGTLTQGITLNAGTISGEVPSSVTLFPASANLTVGQSLQFVPSVKTGIGVSVFAAPTALTLAVSNSAATVTPDGLVTGAASGSANLTATLTGLALSASVPVKVSPSTITHSTWTVLVYMNAANDLYPDSDLNFDQMEQVANNPQMRFVVQWKQSRAVYPSSSFDGVRRYLVSYNTTPGVQTLPVQTGIVDQNGSALDFGNPQTLNDFIKWGETNYPADHYCLVVWDHGNGWLRSPHAVSNAFSYDDQYGTAIQAWQIGQALNGYHFDIVSWDASLMQMDEILTELVPYTSYVAGSEESPPAAGLPYQTVFAPFAANPTSPVTTLARGFVDGMVNDPDYQQFKITQSVVDTSKVAALNSAVDNLGQQLIANASSMAPITQSVRNSAQSYSQTATRYFRDLYDVCLQYEANAGTPTGVVSACQAVRAAITNALVDEGHNAFSANSHGIAIDFEPANSFTAVSTDYHQLKLSQTTSWGQWLAVAP